ncbi:MAG: CBS domain-containing protein [Phycisphaerae bacterium]|nr:CBS domain-containing protein [Phycisphaerae bacterium]
MATVEDILMTKGPDVIVAAPSTTVHEAVTMMCEANVGSVVIKDGGDVQGIFTERDLLRRVVAPGRSTETTELSEVMSGPIASVGLATDVRTCSNTFATKHIRHLAVMEEGTLLGMISLRDVLTIELEEDEEIIHEMDGT